MSLKLRDLPGSESKYWKLADVNKITIKPSPKCQHAFVRTSGTEIRCTKCMAGFMVCGPIPEVIKDNLSIGT